MLTPPPIPPAGWKTLSGLGQVWGVRGFSLILGFFLGAEILIHEGADCLRHCWGWNWGFTSIFVAICIICIYARKDKKSWSSSFYSWHPNKDVFIGAWDAQDMPKICPRYAQDMPKICLRYAWDRLRYAQDMTAAIGGTLLVFGGTLLSYGSI